ncbi:MAG: V-type ATP synthase subunit D [Candidatus Ratteibacteria bacterium]
MKIKTNPTRMELLKLKKRITIAKRGHKLLKDKEEQLLIEFRNLIKTTKKQREKFEEEFIELCRKILVLRGTIDEKRWEYLTKNPLLEIKYDLQRKKIFNIPFEKIEMNISDKFYPNYMISPFENYLYREGLRILKILFTVHELENKLINFAEEIERTRRRVNALEYVLIPSIDEAIKFIQIKLEEYERSSNTILKHLKLIRKY